MAAKTKEPAYMILILEERNGEYEYRHRSVHELSDAAEAAVKKYADKYLKGFYGGKAEKGDEGYYFHDGEVFVRIYSYQLIDQSEYNVLRRYL